MIVRAETPVGRVRTPRMPYLRGYVFDASVETRGALPVRMAVSQYEVLVHVLWEALGGYWNSPREGWRLLVGSGHCADRRKGSAAARVRLGSSSCGT